MLWSPKSITETCAEQTWVVMTLLWFFWLLLAGAGLFAWHRTAPRVRPIWAARKPALALAGGFARRRTAPFSFIGARPPGIVSRAGPVERWPCWAPPWRFRSGDTG
jgi:hypothetical protein